MAELSLRERLQPTLLDRLVDEERVLTFFALTVDLEQLRRARLSLRELTAFVAAQGLSPRGDPRTLVGDAERGIPERVWLRFCAPHGRVSVAQFRALSLETAAAPDGVPLQSFCKIDVHNELNDTVESPDQRYVSPRRLREYVCRDLAVLLNSTSLDASYELSALQEVRRSVLNYGMPSLAGRAPKSVDLQEVARAIEQVIRSFEPRLSEVRVLPDTERSEDDHQLHLRIDAQLWSQPMPQHLVLRTRISTESGDVSVSESGGH